MSRATWVISILILATLACSLSSSKEDSPTALPLITAEVITPSPTANRTPTATAQVGATPTQGTNSNTGQQPAANLPPTVSNCTPRTDWGTYTVQAGDTLGVIATRTNSTIQILTQANCLANPDSIGVGQVLRVPSTPTTGNNTTSTGNNTTSTGNNTTSTGNNTTSTGNNTTSTGNNTTNTGNNTTSTGNDTTKTESENTAPKIPSGLAVKPLITVSGVGFVSLQQTIALDAGVVDNAERVDYYAGTSETDSGAVKIGSDPDPFDGTQVSYDFNDFDDKLYFWAIAVNEFGQTKSNVVAVTYDPNYNPSGTSNSPVSMSPNIGFDGSIYTLQYDAAVTVAWSGAPTNANRIEFYLDGKLISTDTDPTNGAAISWTVPQWILGQVSARAFFSDGRTQDSISGIYAYSEGEGVRPSN